MNASTASKNRNPSRDEFKSRLLSILDSQDIAPATFAKKAGIATATMYSLLKDGDASRVTLVCIAKAADVSLDWLVMGNGPVPNLAPPILLLSLSEAAISTSPELTANWRQLSIDERSTIIRWCAELLEQLLGDELPDFSHDDSRPFFRLAAHLVRVRARLKNDSQITLICRKLVEY